MIRLRHGDSALSVDPGLGNLPDWQVGGRRPLHSAPWREEVAVQSDPDLPLVNKRLAGDFLCMPFGQDDVAGGPIHGPTANAPWEVIRQDVAEAHLRLSVHVRGATVDKLVQITGPVLYQTHRIVGGEGAVTFAHHPMIRMAEGGRLSYSPKRAVLTDPVPQYAGHTLWALNQTRPVAGNDLRLDCEDGTEWDLHHYPAGHRVEDFCILVEGRGARIGWTVAMRNAEDDMLVVLKDARLMPVTMLWVSNGGRDFSPWNGRHTGVLGIEDGCACGAAGLAAALADNRLTAMGVPTVMPLGGARTIRHAMVSLPRPPGWSEVAEVTLARGRMTLTEIGGGQVSVPFDSGFFG
ncbi:hypothetical protein HKCCSP123_05500 [Rhodobacterales bacterium HKCCSP123]|nr:hypothetical protein [Rhodobacterales bacterium HKCCSP123]